MASDFNGDGRDDILWRHDDRTVTNWLATPSGSFTPNATTLWRTVTLDWQVEALGDFNGDEIDDILWIFVNGQLAIWQGTPSGGFIDLPIQQQPGLGLHLAGVGDFDGDGDDDLLWRHEDGTQKSSIDPAFTSWVPLDWHVVGTGDFNGDGRDDVLWEHDDTTITTWLAGPDGLFTANNDLMRRTSNEWSVVATGDFNGDGRDDILWRHIYGTVTDWLGRSDGGFDSNTDAQFFGPPTLAAGYSNVWFLEGTGDYNGDGRDDILWRDGSGWLTTWDGQPDGSFHGTELVLAGIIVPPEWKVMPPDPCLGCWDY